jgi:tellurite resistance protein TerC
MNVGIGGWLAFNAFILALLALDLGVFHRRAQAPSAREALRWTMGWIALALAFGVYLYARGGTEVALEYVTGYIVEKSLSIDNIFVMVMVFAFFRVPAGDQHRVLFWGILGALLLRGAFIGAGTFALHRWHWILYGFGALLLVTGLRTAFGKDEAPDLEHNLIVRLARRIIPVSGNHDEHRFFVRREGRTQATTLLLALCVIEVSDVVFAVDSIPAVFAITEDPFLVYTSNIFAILGLRSMYFVLADFVRRFEYLKYGLSAILVFVGGKMLLVGVLRVPTPVSLAVITAAVGLSILASVLHPAGTVSKQGEGGGEG